MSFSDSRYLRCGQWGELNRDHGEPGAPENLLPVILKSSMQGPDCLSWSLGAGGRGKRKTTKLCQKEEEREKDREKRSKEVGDPEKKGSEQKDKVRKPATATSSSSRKELRARKVQELYLTKQSHTHLSFSYLV